MTGTRRGWAILLMAVLGSAGCLESNPQTVDAGASGNRLGGGVGVTGGTGSGGSSSGGGGAVGGTGGSGGSAAVGGTGSGGSGAVGGTSSSGTGRSGTGGVGGDPGSICELDFDPGPCEAAIPVHAYDADSGVCRERTYGGCEGNANRFDTLAQCQAACVDASHIACDSDADCGWGEIGREILARSDCICLFGCPYIPLNNETIARRDQQHAALCDPALDGEGRPCPVDDCALPSPAMCVEGKCTGDPFDF